ncbi:MAG TPA: hypothetical protein VJS92_10850, partial [Candidatus Polarisedimenticolaceae bacterium]|nr:hypothetical protein [Candidatus Polarisedimenticolaceae bacterium]
MRTLVFTAFALIAFAANSVLCRAALGRNAIDPAGFTLVRLAAGAATLLPLAGLARRRGGGWLSAALLSLYAIGFSYAYLSLGAGTGALILFGAVQSTMIGSALRSGERPHRWEWTGLAVALGGLVYLVSPGLTAPSLGGSLLMALAGVSWGCYSLRGRGSRDALADTAGNFLRAAPLAAAAAALGAGGLHFSARGVA